MEKTVWTPKRVLLLAVSFLFFSMTYMVYAHFLGGINGLPPLPEEYGPIVLEGSPEPSISEPRENEADKKLRIAFGPDCDEVTKRNIKVELQSRGMVFAAENMKFDNGRVKFDKFSLAIFGKQHAGERGQEINTVTCNEATLTFDKPVNNIAEMGSNARKITGAELSGDIYIINNRSTPQRDDDLSLFTQGPLYYEESRHLIWTAAVVKVTDPQSKPNPMVICGTRMYLYLIADNPTPTPGTPGKAKAKADSSMKVERIELGENVDMDLWTDPRSGFLGGGQSDRGQGNEAGAGHDSGEHRAQASDPVEKAKVKIRTQGPFQYNLLTDRATFDISHHSGPNPNVVQVDRVQEKESKNDHLECDHLEIQFQRKNAAAGQAVPDAGAEGLSMETVHATGKEVVLTSDAEVLEAHGNDLFYDKNAHLSILKGQPYMWALKEGNEIEAPELHLLDTKGAQKATALGAGIIRMLDKKTGERSQEARWQKKLEYGKDGAYDLLYLTGDATFLDHEHGQQLQAQALKVWLQPSKENKAEPGSDSQRPSPHHVDALGQVKVTGSDLCVHDTDHLVIFFKDMPPTPTPATPTVQKPPSANPDPTKGIKDTKTEMSQPGTAPGTVASSPVAPHPGIDEQVTAAKPIEQNGVLAPPPQAAPATAAAAPATAAKKKNPIDLSAREIEAHVLRSGTKNELDKVSCEGTVRVRQEPAPPDDKGVDIRGEQLNLVRQADGNILMVKGDSAQVQLQDLYIVGPEVNIDQTTNELWVNGCGAMRLPSDGNLNGTKPAQPPASKPAQPSNLTIYWKKHMHFDGQKACFDLPSDPRTGRGVQGEQEQNTGRVACNAMEVTLDRKISLREGEKSKQQAKVRNVVCDKYVWVEDIKREGTRVVGYHRIECPELSVDNDTEKDDSVIVAPGPGIVRTWQPAGKDELQAPSEAPSRKVSSSGGRRATPTTASKGKEEGEPELIVITYQNRMWVNNKEEIARFFDKVALIKVPSNDPYLQLDPNHPPLGYLYLTCERLEVLKSKLPDGKTYQEMRAFGKVSIEAQEFSGSADVVKYDESKEQVILEGSPGNDAVLYKQKVQGGERETVRATKIFYWRSNGTYSVENGRELRVTQ
jgi:lipopolysaccharide export system protein LptA